MSEEGPGQSKIQDDDCCIVIGDSSDEEFEPSKAGPSKQKEDIGCVVIDSDSDDEPFPERQRAKVAKICSTDEILVISDTDEPPIIIIDDDSDMEGPVVIEDDSCDEGQTFSIEKEIEEFTVSKPNASDDIGEQDVDEKPLSDPEAKLQISDRKMATDDKLEARVEQPKKRKCKTKNICVTPAVKGLKGLGTSSKKVIAAKYGNYKNGCIVRGKEERCVRHRARERPGPEQRGSVSAPHTRNSDCNIPECFFRDIEKSKQYSGKNFDKNRDELVQRIYILMNKTVFDNKMPEKMNITWNKKMLRTAGFYSSGDEHNSKKNSHAKIEISLKVCDSADRVRDTLIHELCHAASWVLHGISDSHGEMWKYYARKSNMVHPELPKVTRYHNYKINYKFYYECVRCKSSRIGRYSKSLDTDRFMCAMCKGPLSLVPQTRKDGTPIRPHVRPFAKYVEKNYRIVRSQTSVTKHKEVMRMLSQEFFAVKQMQNP